MIFIHMFNGFKPHLKSILNAFWSILTFEFSNFQNPSEITKTIQKQPPDPPQTIPDPSQNFLFFRKFSMFFKICGQ